MSLPAKVVATQDDEELTDEATEEATDEAMYEEDVTVVFP